MSRHSFRYQPALDGVRALAVTVVLLFHGGIGWMSGGYLGVSVFFTLSGFLITSLMLHEHGSTGRVAVGAFYTRRARRLLPASLFCLAAISVMGGAGWFRGVDGLRRDVWGAMFQVFNWVRLAAGGEGGYGALMQANSGFRSPVEHYWSLAIEEQFYWIWPLVFLGLMVVVRRLRTRPVVVIGGLTLLAAIAAPLIAAVWGPDVAYWATPARISEILFGALAAAWVMGRDLSPRLQWLAPGALVALGAACVLFPVSGGPAYHGALPLVGLASAALIVGLQADGPAKQVLGTRPFVGLGKISYGVYLYHWPVFVLLDRQGWAVGRWGLLALKLAITLAVAMVSYFALEKPIRTANWLVPRRTLVVALGATAVMALVVLVIPQAGKYYGADQATADAASFDTGSVAPLVPSTTIAGTGDTVTTIAGTDATGAVTTTTGPLVPPRPVRIAIVGDSTAEALGAGMVAWAAANPSLAQVEVVAGAGCGLSNSGYLVFDGLPERDVAAECGPYLHDIVPQRIAELQPDLVMLITTTWDVADRRLEAGGEVLASNDPAAVAQIAEGFQEMTDTLLGLGVPRVVWVTEPIPVVGLLGPSDRQGDVSRHEALHGIMEAIAAANPGAVRVVDLAGWVAEQGLEGDTTARPDAVHWTTDAATMISTDYLGPALVREALT